MSNHIVSFIGLAATKKEGLRAVDKTLLGGEVINCVWPEVRDQLDDGCRTSDNTTMRTVIHRKLEDAELGLGYSPFSFNLFSTFL